MRTQPDKVSAYKFVPFLMWFLPLSFFAYQFILRLWPSLMMHQIMQQFAIDASGFGILASLYYYGYSGLQIPIAMLLDKFGPRYIVFVCALICGLATYVFSTTDSWFLACLSRFLIGVGSAVGFLGTSKVVSQWFAKDHYARMIGFSFTIGLMGAIYGGRPVSILVENYSWEKVAAVLAAASIIIGVLTYLILRSPAKNRTGHAPEPFKLTDLKKLLSLKAIWILAFANFLMVGCLEGFADVWGVPYLMTAYPLTKSDAAELISFIFVGMLFGGPLVALLSRKWGNYTVIALCGGFIAMAFLILLLGNNYTFYMLAALFMMVGVVCCYQVVIFAAGADLVSSRLLGVTVAFLNCINMLGGSFFHTIIGFMMDTFWTGAVGFDGIRQYSLDSYRYALLLIPASAIIGTLMTVYVGRKLYKIRRKTKALPEIHA